MENGKYADSAEETLAALHQFLEWDCPIIIKVHINKVMDYLLKDTHYRNLFEIGTGSGGNDQRVRRKAETAMFGDVYDKAKAFERPKYGCLNVGLNEAGTQQANSYGDGYLLMNDSTVRWRTTLTIMDSFAVNGQCGTVKHCDHLLTLLTQQELQEMVEAATTRKCSSGGSKQANYREIQIHGPVQLDRDVESLHAPSSYQKHAKTMKVLKAFCQKNGCKLEFFEFDGSQTTGHHG